MRRFIAPWLTLGILVAQPAAPPVDQLAPVRFLAGRWTGTGEGRPGASVGSASFEWQLGGQVLVRRSHADIPAQGGRPAAHHEDFMTIFQEGEQLKALYLDNEGHVIRYLGAAVPGGVAFTSEPGPGPAFRLSYLVRAGEAVQVTFEVAPPGKVSAFTTYLSASTRRVP